MRQQRRGRVVSVLALTVALIGGMPVGAQGPGPAEPSSIRGFAASLEMIRDLLSRSRYTEAGNVARALLIRVESLTGPESLEAAAVLDLLGEAARLKPAPGDDPAALADRALAIKERILGPDHPEVATSLMNLAVERATSGDVVGARRIVERALAIREAAFGPNHPLVAASLESLAGLSVAERDDLAARRFIDRVVRIRETAFGTDHPATVRTLLEAGMYYAQMNDESGAYALLDRARAAGERALGPVHVLTLSSLTGLAVVAGNAGHYAEAVHADRDLVARVESAFGPADPRLRFPLDGLAQDLRDLGEYAEARSVAERSLSLSEHTFGPDHPAVAKSLYTLATVLADAGDHAGAIRRLEAATRIGLRRGVNRATGSRGALTDVLRSSGVTERDAPLFVRLVAFRESRYGPARPAAGETLVALAALLSTEEDDLRTRPLFEQSLAAEEAALGPSHPDIATIALNLADVLARAGDAAAATRLYERAVRIREQALGAQHPKLAAALAGLAREHLKAARYGEARSLLERALTIEQATLGPTHPEVAATLVSLAELEVRCGNTGRAFEAAARAEDIRQAHVRLVVRALSERQAQSYAFSGVSPADVMLSVVAGRPGDGGMASAAWNLVISGRGVVLDEMAERHRVATTTGGEAALSLSRQLAAAREQLAAAVVRGIRDDSPERYRQLLDTARRDKERAELELAAESAAFGAARSPTAPRLREVADALPGGSALVAFVRYGGLQLGPGSAPPNGHAARPSYLAFVLRSANDTPFVVPLGPAAAIDGSIEKWRQQIDRQSMAPEWTARAGEAAYRRVASGLRRQLWDPLAPHLSGAERVFVVPDGAIHLVSVAALPSATTGYLAERGPLVHYLSAERDVVREQPGPSRASGLLAFGGVAFDERGAALAAGSHQFRGPPPSCPDFASLRFDPLPASLQEVDQVTQVWTRAQQRQPEPIGDGAARPVSPGATLLAGAAASESAFKAEAGAHEVVHVATHGFFLDERCGARPGAPEASLARLPVPPAIARGNPLLLSGLAFAGANERGAVAPGDDDGILTAEEIASLDLSGVAWAVLSACEAGNGAIKASEGVFGLRRAFQLAGARTVIMSLWRVEDRATRDWMVALYRERFGKGLDTADAVRAASLDVLRRRRAAGRSTHPFYWSGFVAAGEWR